MLPIAIYYEHPDWFRPLLAELARRGVPYVELDAAVHRFDPQDPAPLSYAAVFNRASPSAYLRGRPQVIHYTQAWLRHLERRGVPVINGSATYALEISKADQIGLLQTLGLRAPRTRVINHASQALAAAEGLRYPVLVKANVGGSGAGITRFDTARDLEDAVASGLDLGIDHTALVQESAPLRDGKIHRVELLGRRFLYAIEVHPPGGSFNLCPADACQTADGRELQRSACALDAPKNGMRVAAFAPPASIIRACEAIAAAAELDVGGIEYLIDDRDGEPYFYDINALSNFVADGPNVVGFDPFARLVDYLQARMDRSNR
ncbi:MAG TPA: hypothetical protein VGB85_09580 [Nannocystis sp.]